MENDRLVVRCPEEFLLHRDEIELRILERDSEIIGYRKSIQTSNAKFEALTINPASLIEGNTDPDWITLSVRQNRNSAALFNRSAISSGVYSASILAGGEFIGAMTPGYSVRSISIRREYLMSHPELWVESSRFVWRTAVYDISGPLFTKLNAGLHFLEHTELADAEIDQQVRELFVTLVASLEDCKELESTNRHRIVFKSIQFMRNNPINRVSPLVLAEISHCSPRTLQYAFRKTLGISAKNFIDRYRLSEYRKEMLEMGIDPGMSLQELAKEFGFTHGGNLSKNYRALFGKLPSESCFCDVHGGDQEDAALDDPNSAKAN